MEKKSAGLLAYRKINSSLEVLLVHPGGPFWARKDEGAWSIPKGEYNEGEDPFEVAKREFKEETGFIAEGEFMPLSDHKQPSGKIVSAWAFEGNYDVKKIVSNTFNMEWPPRSGRQAEFPEIDRGDWFNINSAKRKILRGQLGFIEELCVKLKIELNQIDETEPMSKSEKDSTPVQKKLF